MLNEIEQQEFAQVEHADPSVPVKDRSNELYFTTLWVVDRKRVFFRNNKWLHKGGNLLGVAGPQVAQVKKFMLAHDEHFGGIQAMEFTQGGEETREMFVVFDNGWNRKWRHWQRTQVNAAFDFLHSHFTSTWLRQQYFLFENVERYRR